MLATVGGIERVRGSGARAAQIVWRDGHVYRKRGSPQADRIRRDRSRAAERHVVATTARRRETRCPAARPEVAAPAGTGPRRALVDGGSAGALREERVNTLTVQTLQ